MIMEYRVIETALHKKHSIVFKVLSFFWETFLPHLQSQPRHYELETILNQMARQGYILFSQQIRVGHSGRSEAIILIFTRDNRKGGPNLHVNCKEI